MTKTLVGNFTVQNTSLLIENLHDTDTGEKVKSLNLENIKLDDFIFQHVHGKGEITFKIDDDGNVSAKVVLLK